jgi:uncharacterized protein YecE (DUF72 family)
MMRYRLGTHGFSYKDWRGTFYPKSAKQADWLPHYAARFDSIEMNTTFHATPSSEVLAGWRRKTPDDFRFAVKVGQHITHDAPLRHAAEPMRDFIAALQPLGDKLGPLLIQLAPWCAIEQFADFRAFLATLPRGLSYAVEFRSPGWQKREVYEVLREFNVALVALDHEDHPEQAQLHATADFLYVRLVGKHGRYDTEEAERYDPTDLLRGWLERIRAVQADVDFREAWVMCGNDYAGHAPATVRRFAALAGVELPKLPEAPRQTSLFGDD